MIKDSKGITLVVLVITIVILIILAGVSINLVLGQDGLIGKAKKGSDIYSQQQAKEKLELILADMQVDKIDNKEYNQNEYLTSQIEKNGMTVNGDIVSVNEWKFEIDRNIPKIKEKEDENTSNLYLYKDGDEYQNITGNWIIGYKEGTNSSVGSASKYEKYVEIKSWGYWCGYGMTTTNQIDFTEYSRMKLELYDTSYLDISGGYDQVNVYIYEGVGYIKVIYTRDIMDKVYDIDISQINGQHTLQISAGNGANVKIKAVWLEK